MMSTATLEHSIRETLEKEFQLYNPEHLLSITPLNDATTNVCYFADEKTCIRDNQTRFLLQIYTTCNICELTRISVARKYRGEGNGRDLLRAAEQAAILFNCKTMRLNPQDDYPNKKSKVLDVRKFYAKQGYAPDGALYYSKQLVA